MLGSVRRIIELRPWRVLAVMLIAAVGIAVAVVGGTATSGITEAFLVGAGSLVCVLALVLGLHSEHEAVESADQFGSIRSAIQSMSAEQWGAIRSMSADVYEALQKLDKPLWQQQHESIALLMSQSASSPRDQRTEEPPPTKGP